MTLLEDPPGAGRVEELIDEALQAKRDLLRRVVDWGEVFYSIWRARGRETAERAVTAISQLSIEIVDVDLELTKLAAAIRAQHKLPYADYLAASLALRRKGELVTADKKFVQVEKLVKILWMVDTKRIPRTSRHDGAQFALHLPGASRFIRALGAENLLLEQVAARGGRVNLA